MPVIGCTPEDNCKKDAYLARRARLRAKANEGPDAKELVKPAEVEQSESAAIEISPSPGSRGGKSSESSQQEDRNAGEDPVDDRSIGNREIEDTVSEAPQESPIQQETPEDQQSGQLGDPTAQDPEIEIEDADRSADNPVEVAASD
ncbi:uncharacterized protein LOC111673997 isoform X1 [Orussus abietinus]|uniref:uncharacterized protein LOC111673997 isoform X1 n=1 Tax=Orussus abietinus TaxID=222816 RepID=UPI000C716235|nr:uncharacterized protein LOC111673997 isoform X1 [Orussus abietinus]XP_023288365.1 uncharacterized protein LOC111673997 isoform X1 [Orussus abietinus]